MNIYNAIMKAADHIDRNPELFDFDKGHVPECGTPGCALGWIGHFAGVSAGLYVHRDVETPILGGGDFYSRMDELTKNTLLWQNSAAECARGMRLYAEKYHGHEKPQPVVPNWQLIAASPLIPDHVPSEETVS